MTFSSTVMFGKRLKCWNTMPICFRISRRYFWLAGTSWESLRMCHKGLPSTQMWPSVRVSSVISRRRIVVLPEPLGPIRVTFSPAAMSISRLSRTVWSPYRLTTLSKWMNGRSVEAPLTGSSSGGFKADLQFPH